MNYKDKYEEWLNSSFIDEETKNELKNITDEKEIEDRFYKELNFGTAGLRGIIGAGTNRMNKYTVMKATQGLANYINKCGVKNPSVAISYDSRFKSYDFSECAALVLNANGIKTYLSDILRPTPLLSFMVRKLGCTSGIMVTASHNPAEYNGYKVYWNDGCQIQEPVDQKIMDEINGITDYSVINTISKEDAIELGLFTLVGEEIDDKYIEVIKKESLNLDMCKEHGKDISIVYTPLNGTGNLPVRRILKEMGFENVQVVKEQEQPDSNFTTVPKPNPEYIVNYTLGIEQAKKINADVVIATDPDADRLGMAVRDEKGNYNNYAGNMIGSMLCEYILSTLKETGKMPEKGIVVKSIVTTNLVKNICNAYGVELVNVLTGFKYIGNEMNKCENSDKTFIYGFEESMGYLKGMHVRDKDAVVIAMLISELMVVCKEKGISINEYMNNIYKKYGFFVNHVESKKYPGIEGKKQMDEIMSNYRNNPVDEIAGIKASKFIDYDKQIVRDMSTGEESSTGLPKANVIFYELEDGSFVCIRPSGTEPIVKYYFDIKGEDENVAKNKLEKIKQYYL